ncbi:MAG TPA: hypothetical protein VFV34_20210, partial [Blastocatellia bacterium]|nr:hypothetical protein [Blastocatellia bacterium]
AFAVGRSALEALSVGNAVILCDEAGAGPMVTLAEVDKLRSLNFGIRTLRQRLDVPNVVRQIARYDSNDALKVSEHIRSVAGTDDAVDVIVSMYREVIAESHAAVSRMCEEQRAASAYLRWLSPALKEVHRLRQERYEVEQELQRKEAELKRIAGTLGSRMLSFYGPVKYGAVLPVWNYIRKRLSGLAFDA